MSKSDGSSADYYELPKGATQLQDLISFRNLNAQDGEIFRAIYRKGRASHSDELRDARKVLFYAQAEVDRLVALDGTPALSTGPSTTGPALDDIGWIDWDGVSVIPVQDETLVECMCRSGHIGAGRAVELRWHHTSPREVNKYPYDIVKYRVIG